MTKEQFEQERDRIKRMGIRQGDYQRVSDYLKAHYGITRERHSLWYLMQRAKYTGPGPKPQSVKEIFQAFEAVIRERQQRKGNGGTG